MRRPQYKNKYNWLLSIEKEFIYVKICEKNMQYRETVNTNVLSTEQAWMV